MCWHVQVCDHPFLLPDYEPAGACSHEDTMAASGKLVVLDKLLHHLQAHAYKVLLLSHHHKVRQPRHPALQPCDSAKSYCAGVMLINASLSFLWCF